MSALVPCAACQVGDHDNHDGSHHGQPGVLGGHICGCSGGCKPQPNPLLVALGDAITKALAFGPVDPLILPFVGQPIHDALTTETFAAQLANLPETEETP